MAEMQIVEANVEAQYVEMKVPLYSYGCEKKMKKALAHLKGIYSVEVNFEEQKVSVWGICNKYDVLDTIRKKRKSAVFWNPEDNFLLIQEHQEQEVEKELERKSSFSSTSIIKKSKEILMPHFTLIRCRSSFTWRSWKKVFIRSYSF